MTISQSTFHWLDDSDPNPLNTLKELSLSESQFTKRISSISHFVQEIRVEEEQEIQYLTFARLIRDSYPFAHIEEVRLIVRGNFSPASLQFVKELAQKAQRLQLILEVDSRDKVSESTASSILELMGCLSCQFNFFEIHGIHWEPRFVVSIIQTVASNTNPISYGVKLSDVQFGRDDVQRAAKMLKQDPRVVHIDWTGISKADDWIDKWTPNNTIQTLRLTTIYWNDGKLISHLMANCSYLSHLSFACNQNNTETILTAIKTSSIEELDCRGGHDDLSNFNQLLHLICDSKLKYLSIPFANVKNLDITSLEELICSVSSQSRILTTCLNLKIWEIRRGKSAHICEALETLPTNQTLQVLILPKQLLEDVHFVQLFELLRSNSSLHTLKASISRGSQQQWGAVCGYLDSNTGCIEFLDLIGGGYPMKAGTLRAVLKSLANNLHVISFCVSTIDFETKLSLECISNNSRLINLQGTEERREISEALRTNREVFQNLCTLSFLRGIMAFQNFKLLDGMILKLLFEMAPNSYVCNHRLRKFSF
jgi:hypothetical protein